MVELVKKWSIGEVSKILNVSKATLKSWADKGYIPKPHRFADLRAGRYWYESEVQEIIEYRQLYYQR